MLDDRRFGQHCAFLRSDSAHEWFNLSLLISESTIYRMDAKFLMV